MDREQHGWIPAFCGCHWHRGPFHVSTIRQGSRSGYVVYHNVNKIAEFVEWPEVERLADRRTTTSSG